MRHQVIETDPESSGTGARQDEDHVAGLTIAGLYDSTMTRGKA